MTFHRTRDKTLKKYIEGYYFVSETSNNTPLHFISFPGNYFIATICQNVDVTFQKHRISIQPSPNNQIVADFYHKKTKPVKIEYAQLFNEITIYFKPLGILNFMENIKDYELLGTSGKIPFPKYLDEMTRILQIAEPDLKIQALEAYWLSLLKNRKPGLLDEILRDLEHGLKVTEIAGRNGVSRQFVHKLLLKYTGRSPVQYRRIHRFKRMVGNYNKDQTMTQLAHEHFYFDQAHFNKDFKALTHALPRQFFRDTTISDCILWRFE